MHQNSACPSSFHARFLQMLANEGELDGVRILTPESVRNIARDIIYDSLIK